MGNICWNTIKVVHFWAIVFYLSFKPSSNTFVIDALFRSMTLSLVLPWLYGGTKPKLLEMVLPVRK